MLILFIERLGAKGYSLANIEAMCQDVEAFLQILWMQVSFSFFHIDLIQQYLSMNICTRLRVFSRDEDPLVSDIPESHSHSRFNRI